MKKTSLLGLFILSFILFGCKNENSEWERINNSKNIEDYNDYIEKYPDSKFTTIALQKSYELHKINILKKYFQNYLIETFIGNITFFYESSEITEKGRTVIITPIIKVKDTTYVFNVTGSTELIGITSKEGSFSIPVGSEFSLSVGSECKFIGVNVDFDYIPSIKELESSEMEVKDYVQEKVHSLENEIKPLEVKEVLKNTGEYSKSLSKKTLIEVYLLKKFSFEYDIIQTLLIYHDKKSVFDNFILPLSIEELKSE